MIDSFVRARALSSSYLVDYLRIFLPKSYDLSVSGLSLSVSIIGSLSIEVVCNLDLTTSFCRSVRDGLASDLSILNLSKYSLRCRSSFRRFSIARAI